MVGSTLKKMFRTKHVDVTTVTNTELSRCLSTLDLTALGIGSTLGIGIYVLAGQVARQMAGPSVILSFLIAAVASFFAGLCYAELGARVPKTGSAYVYTYVTIGELLAFVIGWNLILEYVIGTASVARGLTGYLDSLVNYQLSAFWNYYFPMHLHGLATYPDFLAFAVVMLLTGVLISGVKKSAMINNVFTVVNLFVVTYVVVCGCFKANFNNWFIPENQVPRGPNGTAIFGTGGFFPYGLSGTLSGAATCFYGFVGFDCIATTGEEVKNPRKAIPISIILCLTGCFLAYFGISGVLTLMIPYFDLSVTAPLTLAFTQVGWPVATYVIATGAIAGLSTSMLGAMFPMPRVIYAMASDGLLFKFLAVISERFKTPVLATVLSGLFAGVMALIFNLSALVQMMSIGTLLAYTLVAASILILRYEADEKETTTTPNTKFYGTSTSVQLAKNPFHGSERGLVARLFKPKKRISDGESSLIVKKAVVVLGLLLSVLSFFLIYLSAQIVEICWWAVTLVTIVLIMLVFVIAVIVAQPQSRKDLSFKVPFVPLIPVLSMFVNIYLMLKLNYLTWIRFAIWMTIGFVVYFGYGFRNSNARYSAYKEDQEEKKPPLTGVFTGYQSSGSKSSYKESAGYSNSEPTEETRLLY